MFGIDDALLAAGMQAGGSILSGIMGSDAAGDAAGKQQEAMDRAITEQRARFNEIKGMTAPYRDMGSAANTRLRALLGLGGAAVDTLKYGNGVPIDSIEQIVGRYAPGDQAGVREALGRLGVSQPDGYRVGIWNNDAVSEALSGFKTPTNDPDAGLLTRQFNEQDLARDVPFQKGMQFGLEQGTKGINERAIANGGYDSGATLKALTRFGNDYGNQQAGAAQARFGNFQNQQYNMLSGQQGVGINATNALSGAGQNSTNQLTQLYGDQGNAGAAGVVGKANAMAGAFGGIGTAIQGYQNNKMFEKIMGNRNPYGGTPYGGRYDGGGTWGYNGGTELA